MAKTKFKQIRLKKVPIDLHSQIKSQAALRGKTLEQLIVDVLKSGAPFKT